MAAKPIVSTSNDPEGTRDRGPFAVTAWEITSPEFRCIVYTQAIALEKLAALPACEIRAVTLWKTRLPDHAVTYHEVTERTTSALQSDQ